MKKKIGFMKKAFILTGLTAAFMMGTTACGFAGDSVQTEDKIEGDLLEVMEKLVEKAQLDADFKEAFAGYNKSVITEEEKEYLLGTTDITYKEGVYAVPMMSSVAFQAVLLRVEEGQNPDEIEELLEKNADPRKWVCVEPEVIEAENEGDVILFLMCDEKTADALFEVFDDEKLK